MGAFLSPAPQDEGKRSLNMIARMRRLSCLPWLALIGLALSLPLLPAPARPAAPSSRAGKPPLPDEPASYGGQPRVLQGGSGEVWSVAVSPDGATLASGSGGQRQNPNST